MLILRKKILEHFYPFIITQRFPPIIRLSQILATIVAHLNATRLESIVDSVMSPPIFDIIHCIVYYIIIYADTPFSLSSPKHTLCPYP